MQAINGFIFGGSATIGVQEAGFKVDRVLEMVDGIEQYNTFHFVRNYPDIPIVPPSVWESDLSYLKDGMPSDIPYGFFNCPCSGLSLVNRNASADNKINDHFFRVAGILKEANYRSFTLENAPALISIGMPVLQKFIKILSDKYKFTVVRDFAANHNVPMKRQRTMIFGWAKEHFDNSIPQIYMNKQPHITIRDVMGGIADLDRSNLPNHSLADIPTDSGPDWIIPHAVEYGMSVAETAARHIETLKDRMTERELRDAQKLHEKIFVKGTWWDKSAGPTKWDSYAPSMTSMTRNIHPGGTRYMTTREYARIMGYPDDFVFYEGAKVCHIQAMAQGVPVQFVKWAAAEVKRNLDGDVRTISTKDVVFQHYGAEKYEEFSHEEFARLEKLDTSKRAKTLRDQKSESLAGFF